MFAFRIEEFCFCEAVIFVLINAYAHAGLDFEVELAYLKR